MKINWFKSEKYLFTDESVKRQITDSISEDLPDSDLESRHFWKMYRNFLNKMRKIQKKSLKVMHFLLKISLNFPEMPVSPTLEHTLKIFFSNFQYFIGSNWPRYILKFVYKFWNLYIKSCKKYSKTCRLLRVWLWKILRLYFKNFNTEKKSNRDLNISCKLLK